MTVKTDDEGYVYSESVNDRKGLEKFFRIKAQLLGYKIRNYSGRWMFGRVCPSVTVSNYKDFIAKMGMKGLKVDNMGLDWIVYTG